MEASKRERLILFGAIPVVAAVLGAVATVIATKLFSGANASEAIMKVVSDPSLSAADKVKLLDLINAGDGKFYSFLTSVLIFLSIPLTAIGWAVADWIKKR